MQAKVVNAGFRRYQVLELSVDNVTVTTRDFDRIDLAERVLVQNTGETPVKVKFGQVLNDFITLTAGETLDLPIKTKNIMAIAVDVEGSLTVIGFSE